MKKFVFLFILFFAHLVFSQNLTVRDIMREPSIAGMRPDSEKISPDGRRIVFAWNAEGKEPRNLYIVDSGGGEPRVLVNAEQNFEARTQPPESKLNYGLIVRDDFVRAREKNLGGVEFSPDSRRILFLQNTDIYVLDLEAKADLSDDAKANINARWKQLEANLIRRADLIPNMVKAMQMSGVQAEQEAFGRIVEARAQFLSAVNETPKAERGEKTPEQREAVLRANENLGAALSALLALREKYPKLRSSEVFPRVLDELEGTENRIRAAREDYNQVNDSAAAPAQPRRITRTQGAESSARWLTNESILYQSGGNFFVLNLKETSLTQVTREANPPAFVTIFGASATEDGRLLAYVVSDGSRQRALYVPNYLDEFTQAATTRRGFTEQKAYVTLTDGSREKPFEINLPKAEGASSIRSVKWAADNASLLVDRIDRDTKRRQIFFVHNVGSKAEQIILVTEETDAKWIAPLSRIVEPHPKDAAQILFASERDGFNHLYLATLERRKPEPNPAGEIRQENPSDAGFTTNVAIKQLTNGNFEIDWAKWTAGGATFVFSSTEETSTERQFYSFEPQTNEKTMIPTLEKGMKTGAQIDKVNRNPILLYGFSRWNQPTELYSLKVCQNCRGIDMPRRITKSAPEGFKKINWSAPKFVDVPTRDGKTVKAKVYLPAGFNQKQKYPMVVFVHGAGYMQNIVNGWNNYFREFMFHTILTQKGYVVLDIDYRGSAGYGRDWRTDVHDFLGGKDYEDHLDAIDFAVKNYAVNPQKIGVYGGSYGGFMAEMLVFRAPEKIAAAAALRPVADWKNYFASSPVYTTERLGFPDKNPEAYRRSSPIAYADKLQKPLLILHGLVDDNVHAQDSIQLIEKLIRLEKTPYFEAMMYPSENHAFQRPTSWADEYERILMFFEKHLK